MQPHSYSRDQKTNSFLSTSTLLGKRTRQDYQDTIPVENTETKSGYTSRLLFQETESNRVKRKRIANAWQLFFCNEPVPAPFNSIEDCSSDELDSESSDLLDNFSADTLVMSTSEEPILVMTLHPISTIVNSKGDSTISNKLKYRTDIKSNKCKSDRSKIEDILIHRDDVETLLQLHCTSDHNEDDSEHTRHWVKCRFQPESDRYDVILHKESNVNITFKKKKDPGESCTHVLRQGERMNCDDVIILQHGDRIIGGDVEYEVLDPFVLAQDGSICQTEPQNNSL